MAAGGRRLSYWFWGILFIILAGGILWSYRSSITPGSLKFSMAQTGTIHHERIVKALYANQEVPIQAPITGKIQFLGENGQRFRAGETVAILQPEGAAPGTKPDNALNKPILAARSGLCFRQSDGLESIITTENLVSLDLEKLLALKASPKTVGATVQAGEIVGKIVNNLSPTQAFLGLPSIDGLTVGNTLHLKTENQLVSAKILRRSEQPMGVVVQFSNYVDGSSTQRSQDITWIYQPPTSGVLVPKSALWTQGEELGIFLSSEGVVHFKKVKVLDQDDDQVCIEGLTSGVPVVITPRDGIEGLVADVKNI